MGALTLRAGPWATQTDHLHFMLHQALYVCVCVCGDIFLLLLL